MSLSARASIDHQPKVAITSSTCERSSKRKSGACSANFSRGHEPVATAIVRAPKVLPQAMSWPVSPMTSTCATAESSDVLRRARAGESAKFVAIVVIVRERAELEIMPESVMPQFQFGAATKITGEQGQHAVRIACRRCSISGTPGRTRPSMLRQQFLR